MAGSVLTPLEELLGGCLRDAGALLKLQQGQIDLLLGLAGGAVDPLVRTELDKARDTTLTVVARLEELLLEE